MHKNKVTIEDLAIMVNKGFEEVGSKFKGVYSQFETMDSKLESMDSKLESMDSKLESMDSKLESMSAQLEETASKDDIRYLDSKIDSLKQDNAIHKYEFEDLSARVKYVETKAGIESGK
jgi:predicted RNase H-like nuclease (RuvC/YqgF family)